MTEQKRVKNCPHRLHENRALRGVKELDMWANRCGIQFQRHPDGIEGSGDVDCHLHGNCLLAKCEFYNEWSLKEVRNAFKKLDDAEKQ
jgi:hypothetical protein